MHVSKFLMIHISSDSPLLANIYICIIKLELELEPEREPEPELNKSQVLGPELELEPNLN